MLDQFQRAVLLVVVGLFSWESALAQAGTPSYTLEIGAQPLDAAIVEFSTATRTQVSADSAILRGQRGAAISGSYTAGDALQRLVADTGLTVVEIDSQTFALRYSEATSPPSGAVTAPEVIEEEVVVIGTKQGRSLQDTQTSVALYTEAEIEEQVLRDLGDAIIRTANVSAAGQGGRALNQLSIRGVTLQGVGNAGTGSTAQVYVDGAPLSFNASQGAQALWDIGQVEILRGPQSTIQGRNALAGAVIVQTNDPEYEWGFRGQVLGGEQDTRQYSLAFTGPILEDELAFRLAADSRESDYGVVNPVTEIDALFQEVDTVRGKLLYEPSYLDGLRLELGVQWIETQFGEFNTINAPVAADDPAIDDFDPFGGETYSPGNRLEYNEVTRYLLDTRYELNARWDLVSILTYEEVFRDAEFVNAGRSVSDDETWAFELRSHFDYGQFWGWFGVYYFDGKSPNDLTFDFPAVLFGGVPTDSTVSLTTLSDEQTENWALFGDVTWELSQNWELNFGLRYDEEEFSAFRNGVVTADPPDCVVPAFGDLPCTQLLPAGDDPPTSAEFSAWLPRGAVTYRFSEDQSVSFGIQRGYRAGGSYIRNNALEGVIETGEFDPEYLTNYEFSYRSQWLERRLTVNANLFYADWEDQQVSIPGPSGALLDVVVENAGESNFYGLEVLANVQFTAGFDAFLSLGFLETEFTDFPYVLVPGNEFSNLSGNQFPNAPGFSGALGLNYRHSSGLYTNWTFTYTGEAYSDIENLPVDKVGDYTLLNGRIGYRRGVLDVHVFGTNILDEEFITEQNLFSVSTDDGSLVPNASPFWNISNPRVIGLSLAVSI